MGEKIKRFLLVQFQDALEEMEKEDESERVFDLTRAEIEEIIKALDGSTKIRDM